jgi:hypothetical protein
MNLRAVKSVALLVSGLMWVSTGLAPVLAVWQQAEASESEPGRAAQAGKTTSPAAPEQSDQSEPEGDESKEEGACAGFGVGDLMNREQRSLKPSLLAELADSPTPALSSSADHPRRSPQSSPVPFVRCDWGQRAHWPCGPPAVHVMPSAWSPASSPGELPIGCSSWPGPSASR